MKMRAAIARFVRGLRRPSKAANARRMRRRGEDPSAFAIRDAREDEIPALARLHVITWNDTYPAVRRPPTVALRERQWREKFAAAEPGWFCLVAERGDGELVGFAQGNRYSSEDQPAYAGQLNKIYLLREYQRLGLGRRLMGHAARRFLADGVGSMLLFADEGNPSLRFYAALGGENLVAPDGTVSPANFGWKDLRLLAARCPAE